ncbi:MAG: choice-of-anchor tandem repeat GloVer-containing protein [Methylobacter sp.]
MKLNPFSRSILGVLLGWLALSGFFWSSIAEAALEYQIVQSLGKREGTPTGKLTQGSDGNFYGSTYYGGSSGAGTVFKMDSSGSFSVLHEFDGAGGANPYVGLIQGSDGNFYGTTLGGGSSSAGTIFKISPSGDFTVLHEFDGADGGATPYAGLIQANDGNFYGTTFSGGSNSNGTVFKIDASGNFNVLHNFGPDNNYANSPYGGVIQGSDGSLYGTTSRGGLYTAGTVFKMDLAGNLTILYDFKSDGTGDYPSGSLIQASDGSFYGTTFGSSAFDNNGTVYKIDASGNFTHLTLLGSSSEGLIQASDGNFYITTFSSGFPWIYDNGWIYKMDSAGILTLLHAFTWSGGASPNATLTQGNDGRLYGVTKEGGSFGSGTVFQLDLSGNFQVLHEFEGTEVIYPNHLIQASDGSFYGTTSSGGIYGFGTVFQRNPSGNLTILHSFDGYSEGAFPSTLMQGNDGSLYGITTGGYLDYYFTDFIYGTLFKIDPDGSFRTVYNFDGGYLDISDLIQANDGNFYGTINYGYDVRSEVFKIDLSGNFSVLHPFDEAEGFARGSGGVIQADDGNLYGTTYNGGGTGSGTVYKLDLSGNYSVLHEFDGANGGANPTGGLVQGSDSNFYGTTGFGGSYGAGIIFNIDFSGNFNILHEFDGTEGGIEAYGRLIQAGEGNFYGTASSGGSEGKGILFKLDSLGNFTLIHSFNGTDGASPSKLIQAHGGSLYGITRSGGEYGGGVIFRLVENTEPVANAGFDQTANVDTLVTLNGTSSSDPDNGPSPLTYSWTQTSGPTVTLTGADTAQPSFIPLTPGTYVFSLVVNDGRANSAFDSVTVTVNASNGSNAAPTAQAGPDQSVDAGTRVTLNGTGSSDPDNGPSPLTYRWSQSGGDTVTLTGATTARPSFTPLTPGTYTFNLVVHDGQASSTADSVAVTVNETDYVLIQTPNGGEVWNEKSKQTITWISRNLDSKLKLVLYLSIDNGQTWTQIASPKNVGSKTWKIPKNRYVAKEALFKLCVKRYKSLCDFSDAVFTINKAPVAEAGTKQKVTIGAEVHLDGSASHDDDSGPSPLNYQWTQKSGPTVTLNGAVTATPSFTPAVKGSYKFSLVVNDGAAESKADKVTVRVQNAP